MTPGNYGDSFAQDTLGLDLTGRCTCSNYVGAAIDHAAGLGFSSLLLVGHLGKLIKVAAGNMNTHSKVADGRRETLTAHAALAGGSPELLCPVRQPHHRRGGGAAETGRSAGTSDGFHRPGPGGAIETPGGAGAEDRGGFFSNQYGLLGKTSGAEGLLALHRV